VTQPPGLALRWLERSLHPDERDELLGDLQEQFERRVTLEGPRRARRWYWRQTFGLLWGFARVRRDLISTTHERRRGRWAASTVALDCMYAWRSLRASPSFALVAILSLALGIGANAAIFSLVDGLMLRTLPVRAPDRLVHLLVSKDNNGWTNPLWEQIRDHQHEVFDGAVAWSMERFNLASSGPTELVDGMYASGGFFDVLGVPAIVGRTFTPRDDERGGGPDGPVAVISYAFWQRRFGGAGDVIGRSIALERVPFTIIGVAPPLFLGPSVGEAFDIAVPIGTEALIGGRDSILDARSSWWLDVLARLKPGQTVDDAERVFRGMQPILRQATLPADWGSQISFYLKDPFSIVAASTGTSDLRMRYERPLETLMVVVGLVLLIACANIANLLLARAVARRRELSIRQALGASRWALARQLLSESLLLSGVGALVGLLVARWGSALLVHQLSSRPNGVVLDLSLDWRVLGFTALVAIATAVLFGTAPALRATRVDPNEALKAHGRGVSGQGAGLSQALVIAQVAVSLLLIVAAGLFVRTFTTLATRDLGFSPERVLVVNVDAARSTIAPADRGSLYERLRQAVAALPGVTLAAASTVTPVSGWMWGSPVDVPDGPPQAPRERGVYLNLVTPDWFKTYGTAIVAGRDFTSRDTPSSPMVTIVNETFVHRRLGHLNPIGRRLTRPTRPGDPLPTPLEIVGVVADAVYANVREAVPPTMYLAVGQQKAWASAISVSVRTAALAPGSLTKSVTAAIGGIDPDLSLTFRPLADQVSASLIQERMLAMLSGFFGLLALVLAGLGLYGVTSYVVNRRRAEMGIRLALGAQPGAVLRLVLRRVALLLLGGIGCGAALSLWASRYVSTLLYGLEPRDPSTLITAGVLLLTIGALAGWAPARRAASLDPARVFREDP
jgi:putative ABC transport system permease protein